MNWNLSSLWKGFGKSEPIQQVKTPSLKPFKILDMNRSTILRMREQGKTLKEISSRFEVSEGDVGNWIRVRNLKGTKKFKYQQTT